jgi:phenylpropionate dioxygenase-like ring-hydroxylating dioxygenase large terminal subunit
MEIMHDMMRAPGDPDFGLFAERRAAAALALQRRMMAHMSGGPSTDTAPGPMSNDAKVYFDPERFAAEKRELFGRLPLLAGLSNDVPGPGDKMLFEETGVPILIVRGTDNRVRAFRNMCTHRGAKLVETCDARKRMTCRFHGWTFDLEGRLVGLPDAGSFEGVARDHMGLLEVPCVEWAGLLMIKTDPGGEPIDAEAFLGDFAPVLALMEFDRAVPVKKGRIDVKTNWKYALDTYGEGYHFATLHPTTIGTQAVSNVMVYDTFGPHHRCGFPRKAMADDVGKPEAEWAKMAYGGIHLLFPNSAINVSPMPDGSYYYALQRMFPGERPGEAFTLIWSYRFGEKSAEVDAVIAAQHDYIMHVVSTEDYSVSEGGWRNLIAAPEGFRVNYGANELALQHLHLAIAEAIRMPLP